MSSYFFCCPCFTSFVAVLWLSLPPGGLAGLVAVDPLDIQDGTIILWSLVKSSVVQQLNDDNLPRAARRFHKPSQTSW
jgi:hypothetical protein